MRSSRMYQQGPLSQYAHKPNELYELKHQVAFMRCQIPAKNRTFQRNCKTTHWSNLKNLTDKRMTKAREYGNLEVQLWHTYQAANINFVTMEIEGYVLETITNFGIPQLGQRKFPHFLVLLELPQLVLLQVH